jgi:biotin-(acetyl-CoA carboxylase) ligase
LRCPPAASLVGQDLRNNGTHFSDGIRLLVSAFHAANISANKHTSANEGIAILADEQSGGRGQHGRTWLAEPRQRVLLSILLSPPLEVYCPAVLTAGAAVTVCEIVRLTIGRSA